MYKGLSMHTRENSLKKSVILLHPISGLPTKGQCDYEILTLRLLFCPVENEEKTIKAENFFQSCSRFIES